MVDLLRSDEYRHGFCTDIATLEYHLEYPNISFQESVGLFIFCAKKLVSGQPQHCVEILKHTQSDRGFYLQARLLEQTSRYTESGSRSLDSHHMHPDHSGAQHHHRLLPLPQTVLG